MGADWASVSRAEDRAPETRLFVGSPAGASRTRSALPAAPFSHKHNDRVRPTDEAMIARVGWLRLSVAVAGTYDH